MPYEANYPQYCSPIRVFLTIQYKTKKNILVSSGSSGRSAFCILPITTISDEADFNITGKNVYLFYIYIYCFTVIALFILLYFHNEFFGH